MLFNVALLPLIVRHTVLTCGKVEKMLIGVSTLSIVSGVAERELSHPSGCIVICLAIIDGIIFDFNMIHCKDAYGCSTRMHILFQFTTRFTGKFRSITEVKPRQPLAEVLGILLRCLEIPRSLIQHVQSKTKYRVSNVKPSRLNHYLWEASVSIKVGRVSCRLNCELDDMQLLSGLCLRFELRMCKINHNENIIRIFRNIHDFPQEIGCHRALDKSDQSC